MERMERRKTPRTAPIAWRDGAAGLLVPVLAIALWQWVAASGMVDRQVLPAPLDVWRKWVDYLLPLQPYAD